MEKNILNEEAVSLLREHIIEELRELAKFYRRKANYKKYSKGMKSAFKNRAVGIDRSITTIDSYLRVGSEEFGDIFDEDTKE